MTNLERLALLGDKGAQKECTEKGILLPCPFCGGEAELNFPLDIQPVIDENGAYIDADITEIPSYAYCSACGASADTYEDEENAIKAWNTRQAPPIGRCEDCERRYENEYGVYFCSHIEAECGDNDYCSYFEPRCEE